VALTSNVIYAALAANRASGGFAFAGVPFDQLAQGIAVGVWQWGVGQPQNLGLTGAAAGVSGGGAIVPATSRLSVPPNSGVVYGALVGAGMVGGLASPLATSVALGISQAFSVSGQYAGPVVGVGTGADVSKVAVSNAATLIGILRATLSAVLGTGPALSQMATGLGNGIAALLLLGTGQAPVVGTPTVPAFPAATATTSVVV